MECPNCKKFLRVSDEKHDGSIHLMQCALCQTWCKEKLSKAWFGYALMFLVMIALAFDLPVHPGLQALTLLVSSISLHVSTSKPNMVKYEIN